MGTILLERVFKHMKDQKVIGSSQHGFTKGKSYLTNLITFYDEMIGLVDRERTVNVVYLAFSKAFNTVSNKILIEKLLMYRLDEQKVRWTENWLNRWTQRVVISGIKFTADRKSVV